MTFMRVAEWTFAISTEVCPHIKIRHKLGLNYGLFAWRHSFVSADISSVTLREMYFKLTDTESQDISFDVLIGLWAV